jgi:hypothetical protein
MSAKQLRRGRWHLLLLAAIVLLGGWLRFSRLDLMEFKGDEWRLHRLAVSHAQGDLQLHGIMSSVHVWNPPMSVYLYAIPASVSPDPIGLACLTALLNTLAVGLTYWLARQWLPRGPSLVVALLFAVSPWAVLESRKIWAQQLLPFFTISFFLGAVGWLRKRRLRDMALMAVSLAVMSQLHYSSLALWPIVLWLAWKRRSSREWRAWALGALVFILLWTPFLIHLGKTRFEELTQQEVGQAVSQGPVVELVKGLRWEARTMGHGGFEDVLGAPADRSDDALRTGDRLTLVLALLLAAGMAVAISRLRRQPELWLLLLWFFLPPLLLSPLHKIELHYVIVTWPANFLFVGLLVDEAAGRIRAQGGRRAHAAVLILALAGLGTLVLEEAAFSRKFLDVVSQNGGTMGDYGITYRDKLRVARYLKETVLSGPFSLLDYTNPFPSPDTYACLYQTAGGQGIPLCPEGKSFPPGPIFAVLGPFARLDADPKLFRQVRGVALGPLRVETFLPLRAYR